MVGDYLDAGLGDVSGLLAEVWVHRYDLPAAQAILQRSQLGGAPQPPDEEEEEPA